MSSSFLIGAAIIVVLALVFPAIIFFRVAGSVAKGVASDDSPEEKKRKEAAAKAAKTGQGDSPSAASEDA